MKPWIKNGKPVMKNGKPALCDTCPCEEQGCDALKARLEKLHKQLGGVLYNEGFYDYWIQQPQTEADIAANYRYVPFLGALVVGSACYVLDCECSNINVLDVDEGVEFHNFEGACDAGECDISMMSYMRWYGDKPEWEIEAYYNCDYACAIWDARGRSIVTPASGNLLVAFPEALPTLASGSSSATVSLQCSTYVTAGVLRNTVTGSCKLIGCQCGTNKNSSNPCPKFGELDDWNIGGVAPVYSGTSTNYLCSISVNCDVRKMYVSALAKWHNNVTEHGECLLERIDASTHAITYPSTFAMALGWTLDDSDSDSSNNDRLLLVLNCNCNSLTLRRLPTTDTIIEYEGACTETSDCNVRLFNRLHASAIAHNWEWHGNTGSVIVKANNGSGVYGDWYLYPRENDIAYGRACAVAADWIYTVPCSCNSYTNIGCSHVAHPQGTWTWYEWDSCGCFDKREFVLDDPATFGVLSISWGNNTKYWYTNTYEGYDEGGEYGTFTDTGYGIVGATRGYHGLDMFLENRTLCWIQKRMTSGGIVKQTVCCISPTGSPQEPYDLDGDVNWWDEAQFVGHVQPFTHDADLDWTYAGNVVVWLNQLSPHREKCGFENYADAEAYNETVVYTSQYCAGNVEFMDNKLATRLSPPDFTPVTLRNSRVYSYETPQGDTRYCAEREIVGNGIRIDDDDAYVYREQWIDTNKGLIRMGESTYNASILVYGAKDDPYGDDSNTKCADWVDVPLANTTMEAELIDDDMHGCESHEVDWIGYNDSESL